MSASTLAAEGVSVELGGRPILEGVSVVARAGEPLALTGPSGSGKTTLLLVMAGLLLPDTGRVTYGATALGPDGAPLRARRGLVLQAYGLAEALTAEENVTLPLQARGIPRTEVRERATNALAAVGLSGLAGHLIGELSGGQQQRVALARALAVDPEVLLADEPTSELDADSRELVLERLLRLAAAGKVVVLASHDPEVTARCTTVLRLHDGRVEALEEGQRAPVPTVSTTSGGRPSGPASSRSVPGGYAPAPSGSAAPGAAPSGAAPSGAAPSGAPPSGAPEPRKSARTEPEDPTPGRPRATEPSQWASTEPARGGPAQASHGSLGPEDVLRARDDLVPPSHASAFPADLPSESAPPERHTPGPGHPTPGHPEPPCAAPEPEEDDPDPHALWRPPG